WNIHAMKRDLNGYAYDCTEQLTSRGFAALSDLNDDNKSDVERIIRRVADQQQPSGGFSLWFGGVEDPWLTTYGYHFLNVAKEKGAGVSPTTVDKAKSFMRSKLKRLSSKPTPEDLFGVAY